MTGHPTPIEQYRLREYGVKGTELAADIEQLLHDSDMPWTSSRIKVRETADLVVEYLINSGRLCTDEKERRELAQRNRGRVVPGSGKLSRMVSRLVFR